MRSVLQNVLSLSNGFDKPDCGASIVVGNSSRMNFDVIEKPPAKLNHAARRFRRFLVCVRRRSFMSDQTWGVEGIVGLLSDFSNSPSI